MVAKCAPLTLCGKSAVQRHWRAANDADNVHCVNCQRLLKKITGGTPSAPLKVVRLELTPTEYKMIALMKTGVPTFEIDKIMGWKRGCTSFLRTIGKRNGITTPELRTMLAYIQPIDPASKKGYKPTVWRYGGRYAAVLSHKEGGKRKIKQIGLYDTEAEAIEAGRKAKRDGIYVPGQGIVKF